MLLGIDGGNADTKVCGPYGVIKFSSSIGPFRERRLKQEFGSDDMVVEYKGSKYLAGTVAKYEAGFGGSSSRKGDTKAHEHGRLRILMACFRYTKEKEYQIVVGQPIGTHDETEKMRIKQMLTGEHQITINGESRTFTIKRVEVAAEGAAASLADPKTGIVRYIDIGSGTVNFATTHDMRYIDADSWTVREGMETTIYSRGQLAEGIADKALERWAERDCVRILGGGAEPLLPLLRVRFPNTELLTPKIQRADSCEVLSPVFANAVGFFEIARKVYA